MSRALTVLAALLILAALVLKALGGVAQFSGAYWGLSLLFVLLGWAVAWAAGRRTRYCPTF
jgi:hypothetical protein